MKTNPPRWPAFCPCFGGRAVGSFSASAHKAQGTQTLDTEPGILKRTSIRAHPQVLAIEWVGQGAAVTGDPARPVQGLARLHLKLTARVTYASFKGEIHAVGMGRTEPNAVSSALSGCERLDRAGSRGNNVQNSGGYLCPIQPINTSSLAVRRL